MYTHYDLMKPLVYVLQNRKDQISNQEALEQVVSYLRLNDEQKNLVESIKDDATRLLKITGELLNMTQVESGNIQLSIMPADPKEILLYAINATQTQADQKQIKFNIECPDSISKVQAAMKTRVRLSAII